MKAILPFVILFFVLTASAQNKNELSFIKHLINKELYNEAIYIIDNNQFAYNKQQKDSIFYFHGWANYSLKNLKESTNSLLKVGIESPLFRKSHFFAGYNQIYLSNYHRADSIFEKMKIEKEPELSIMNFERSGIEMLKGNWSNASDKLEKVDLKIPVLNEHTINLRNICKEQINYKSKSPALAGIMSGIIPGSGKIYAGKTGAGIASMISTIGFGFITWENYNKKGLKNAKTLIFGSLFAFNYVSNIYGSVISVKVSENEYNNAIHNQILFELHIPLRNFFE